MAANDPQVIFNIDDVGMCHGANTAYLELARAGAVDSGSVMVPCPWFSEIAEEGAGDASLNLGVHLTLTAEKRHYRWRPLTGASRASGLVDGDGFMWRSVVELRRHANPEAAEAEMRAQIDAFLATGIRPSHLDGHMGAVLAPEFCDRYVTVALDYGIPTLFPASLSAYMPNHNLQGVADAALAPAAERLAASGQRLADRVLETPWNRDRPREDRYDALLDRIGPGLTFICFHANAPGELELIEPGSAAIRIDEYELLASPGFRAKAAGLGLQRGSLRDLTATTGVK